MGLPLRPPSPFATGSYVSTRILRSCSPGMVRKASGFGSSVCGWKWRKTVHARFSAQKPGALNNMGGSINGGIPKSSIFMGFSILNHPLCDIPILGNPIWVAGWSCLVEVACCCTSGCLVFGRFHRITGVSRGNTISNKQFSKCNL